MKKIFLILAIAASIPALACAKKPKKVVENDAQKAEIIADDVEIAADEQEPTITEDCMRNVSLAHEYVRSKQFVEAYEPWMAVYTECPNANKSIYTDGAKIIEALYGKAKAENNEAEMTRLANLSMEMYNKRIKYFGDDAKYPKAYILGEKGLAYIDYFPNDELKEPAYKMLKKSIDGLKVESKITVLVEYMKLSLGFYRSNPQQYADQFISDYTLVNSYLKQQEDNPANKNASVAGQQSKYIDELFATSGAADCEKLDELYASYIATNGQYLEDMLNVMKLYKRVNCTESEVYFQAAEIAHKMQPTEESAVGCAKMCMKKEDWKGAIGYYGQAISLIDEESEDNRDDYLYAIAYIQYDKLKNYMEARTMARLSLEANPHAGRCYILIGLCYAGTKPYSQSEYGAKAAILNKTVFWAAVDKFRKAKEVDPTCEADANQLIAAYSKYFPTKEDRFDLPNEFGNGSFIVGGWINESTLVR